MMAAGGKFEGREYLGEEAWQALHDQVKTLPLGGLGATFFTQGGINLFQLIPGAKHRIVEVSANRGREGFYGWMGMGGSVFQWHPELEIGFGFVPNVLHMIDMLNERGKTYQAEVLRCVKQIEGAKNSKPIAQGKKTTAAL